MSKLSFRNVNLGFGLKCISLIFEYFKIVAQASHGSIITHHNMVETKYLFYVLFLISYTFF